MRWPWIKTSVAEHLCNAMAEVAKGYEAERDEARAEVRRLTDVIIELKREAR